MYAYYGLTFQNFQRKSHKVYFPTAQTSSPTNCIVLQVIQRQNTPLTSWSRVMDSWAEGYHGIIS